MKEGKVLMAFRKASHGANTYQFPGGHLEYLESFAECARREVREECGVEIEHIEFVYVANMIAFAPKHFVHIGLTAEWKSGEPKDLEPENSGPWDWYALDALPTPLNIYAELHLRSLAEHQAQFDAVSTSEHGR